MGAVIKPTARNGKNGKNKETAEHSCDEVPGKRKETFQQDDKHSKPLLGVAINEKPRVEEQRKRTQTSQQDEVIKPLVVVALDFGTTHSGFAYSFKGYEENIKSAEHGGILQQDRVPTILLLNPDKSFHSFGYEAQTYFHELSDNDKSKFYYFENFKMKIYSKIKIEREMVIKEISGKQLEAMVVFSTAIKHLKDEASRIIHVSKIGLKKKDIQWMITIPAISSDSARQFMREASTKAGILQTHLRLVLEPEAAALYSKPRIMSEEMPCGFQYVLADLGGGTSDICVHKTLDDGKLQEVYRSTGETSGGGDVDNCFINMMETLTGPEVWNKFSSTYSSAYISLVNEFRLKKKEFRPDTRVLRLRMENALVHIIDKRLKKSLNDIIKESKYAGKLEYHSTDSRLIMNIEMLEELFMPSVDRIIDKLNEVLDNCADIFRNKENTFIYIKTILLVGGFGESPYLRDKIQSEFSYMRVILVDNARLAVLNGAVMMGWQPKNIIQRRSRYTYGLSVSRRFIEGKDLEYLKVVSDGKVRCKKSFRKMIEKGQIVEYGKKVKHKSHRRTSDPARKYKKIYLRLYRSTLEDPHYCIEEEECSLVGKIVLIPPLEGWPDYWEGEYQLIVGETEFTVKYFNLTTGEEYEAQMDFL